MRTNKIRVFYNPKQVLLEDSLRNFSKSPLKPALLLEHIQTNGLMDHLEITSKFRAFERQDIMIAHHEKYVNDFFNGTKPLANSNGLQWSEQFADSVRYTNASLYEAIRNSIVNPDEVSFSPTSGFHHAKPTQGMGFCTFAGQVIASVKIYRKLRKVGCYIDLDGHFGNAIEDSRSFQTDINKAVPMGFNFNTREYGSMYFKCLRNFVKEKLEPAILSGKIDYVVWCHGADSHEGDDMSGQVSTKYWIQCSTFFWSWVKEMDAKLGRSLPVSCALFGGYRSDDYTSVLSLHTADLVECMNELLDLNVTYELQVVERKIERPNYFNDNTRKEKTRPRTSTYSSTMSTGLKDRLKRREEAEEAMLEFRRRLAREDRDYYN